MPETEPVPHAFILFNEQEDIVEKIVSGIEERGVKTLFWRRDIPIGKGWDETEDAQLKRAQTVVVFLGKAGWGPNHRKLAIRALQLKKVILPVLIGDALRESREDVDSLFIRLRYFDLRIITDDGLSRLAQEILLASSNGSPRPASARESRQKLQVERIIGELVDGNEEERAWALRQVIKSDPANKKVIAARLREEISGPFSPNTERDFHSARRDPKKFSSIRSWMMSCLIRADAEDDESRKLILDHLHEQIENDRNVRFWTLAGLYHQEASYLSEALEVTRADPAPEVSALQQAIADPRNDEVIASFRSKLESPDFRRNWEVLRVLRVIWLPKLVDGVCRLLIDSDPASARAYDSLYALSNRQITSTAAKILAESPGVDRTVEIVISVSLKSDENAQRNFCDLLAAFDPKQVDAALNQPQHDVQRATAATTLRQQLKEIRTSGSTNQIFVAGYASDRINIEQDYLDIQEDVQTLVAVMLSKEVEPPLAIGLFGDWGTGKSYFMQSMKAAIDDLAERSSKQPNPQFVSNIVQIEFNAWHYIDANLWASLVSYILEQLAAYVAPEKSEEEQQKALLSELSTAKAIAAEADAERLGAQKVIRERTAALQTLQLRREAAEVQLSNLRLSDLANLLTQNKALEAEVKTSLKDVGAPVALEKASDLSSAVADAHSLRGRAVALFLALGKNTNKATVIVLIIFVLVVIPLIAWLLNRYVFTSDVLAASSAIIAQVTGIIAGVTVILRRAFNTANSALTRVEEAKQQVDQLLAEKRKEPTEEEKNLENQIASYKAQEHEASARVAAAATRVTDLERQIRAITEGRSLARFLGERVRSEDYRKHLGLISTIRRDFESLANRLARARKEPEEGFRPADRIILYIDDLDRCPARRVIDVLQAVHLLLAYQLFIVVVGVDPRWLLHSLGTTYGAFGSGNTDDDSQVWRTTPQNYLEKIFQIPFNLRPMSDDGYRKLVSKLLTNEDAGPAETQEHQNISVEPKAPDSTEPRPVSGGGLDRGDPSSEPKPGGSSEVKTNEPEPKPPIDEIPARTFQIQDDALVVNDWEAKFAVKLFSLIPNPRATKRFSNIYRILKAHVRREDLRQFEGTAVSPGDFQIAMLLLALLIGNPDECAVLFPKLQRAAMEGDDVLECLHDLKKSGIDALTAGALEGKLNPIVSDPAFPNTAEVFLEWLPRVSRFSFEVGRVLQPLTIVDQASQLTH